MKRLDNIEDYLNDKDLRKINEKTQKFKNKKERKMLPVYKGMTLKQLAETLERDIYDIVAALKVLEPNKNYKRKSEEVSNFNILLHLVKQCGYSPQIVPHPDKVSEKKEKDTDIYPQPLPDPSKLVSRPPVVTIMGHVDHGKTTLLDALRNTRVVDQEFGGITQHIGAFSVKMSSGKTITFLDTPGHKAFSAMRARGASITDIVILVVAADDGIMPTTIESIQHAVSANVPIIVAINKIDLAGADIERTEKMLLQHSIVTESQGGDVQCIPISALKKINLEQLQEAIITQAEIMEISGDPTGLVEGRVVESKTDKGKGKVATVVIQRGTLKIGDLLIAGSGWAKVRGIFSDNGTSIKTGTLSAPIEITGWKELPSAGDQVLQAKNEEELKAALEWRKGLALKAKMHDDQKIIDEKREQHDSLYKKNNIIMWSIGHNKFNQLSWSKGVFERPKEVEIEHEGPSLNIILKGDVSGSLEAILNSLVSYNSKKCRLNLIHHSIGEVTASDVEIAESFDGEIFAFNVPVPSTVKEKALTMNVPVHEHNVIYKLFDSLLESLRKKLPKIDEDEQIGEAEVLALFNINVNKKKVPVAGCRCNQGSLQRKGLYKVIRDNEEIYRGTLSSLKHLKTEVDSIKKDTDCGISLSDTNIEFKLGDKIICFKTVKISPDIDWEPEF